MNRRWLLGGLLAAGGIGLATLFSKRPKIRDGSRVMLIGDSLAKGLDVQMSKFAAEQVVPYLGRGIQGTRLDQWAYDAWLPEAIRSFKPTMILVSLGTNDAALGKGAVDRQRPAFQRLLGILKASGAEIVWIGPPTLPFPDNGVPEMLRASAPYWFASADYEIPRGPDNLHPTARGYAGWSAAIWDWLS